MKIKRSRRRLQTWGWVHYCGGVIRNGRFGLMCDGCRLGFDPEQMVHDEGQFTPLYVLGDREPVG